MLPRKLPVLLKAGLAELLMVAVGYRIGICRDGDAHSLAAKASPLGLACAVASLFYGQSPAERMTNRLSALGLWLYVISTEALQFPAHWVDARALPYAIAWLAPLAVGGVVLPRRGAWLAGVGFWLLLFGGVYALAYNFTHCESGMTGFLGGWVS
jgi:hypothetical protein